MPMIKEWDRIDKTIKKVSLMSIPSHLFHQTLVVVWDNRRACHINGVDSHRHHSQHLIFLNTIKIKWWICGHKRKGTPTAKHTIKKGRNRRISRTTIKAINNNTDSLETNEVVTKVRTELFPRTVRLTSISSMHRSEGNRMMMRPHSIQAKIRSMKTINSHIMKKEIRRKYLILEAPRTMIANNQILRRRLSR